MIPAQSSQIGQFDVHFHIVQDPVVHNHIVPDLVVHYHIAQDLVVHCGAVMPDMRSHAPSSACYNQEEHLRHVVYTGLITMHTTCVRTLPLCRLRRTLWDVHTVLHTVCCTVCVTVFYILCCTVCCTLCSLYSVLYTVSVPHSRQ